ncbi:MAG: hypothetical protein EOO02_16345 [Chitinophagaceae bacterium]|nr:MAG: hypothetical protein EOO02_16345 [Chitinophagaceae bacterium]
MPPIFVGTHPGSTAFEIVSGHRRATALARIFMWNFVSE